MAVAINLLVIKTLFSLFGDGSGVAIVGEFCYLGDMLSVDGDADAAVTARIHTGWFKLRSPILTAKDVSLFLQEKVYDTCTELYAMLYVIRK